MAEEVEKQRSFTFHVGRYSNPIDPFPFCQQLESPDFSPHAIVRAPCGILLRPGWLWQVIYLVWSVDTWYNFPLINKGFKKHASMICTSMIQSIGSWKAFNWIIEHIYQCHLFQVWLPTFQSIGSGKLQTCLKFWRDLFDLHHSPSQRVRH